MRMLVVGASGQVGRAVVRSAKSMGYDVMGTYLTRPPMNLSVPVYALDKTDSRSADNLLRRLNPGVVVDTSALHNVDFCESHPEEAHRVNAEGTSNVSQAAAAVGARFVYISTDYVFDGKRGAPYTEECETNPESVYGASKLEGERLSSEANSNSLIVRPSVVYSWLGFNDDGRSSSGKGVNFGTWLARELHAGRPVRVVRDQTASPTLASDVGDAIVALLATSATGVFHAAGRTATDRYTFAVKLAEAIGADSRLIQPVDTRDLNQQARRPLNSSLNSSKLAETTGRATLTIEEQLGLFSKQYRSGYPD